MFIKIMVVLFSMKKINYVYRQRVYWLLLTTVISLFFIILAISLGLHSAWKSRSEAIYIATSEMDNKMIVDLDIMRDLAIKHPKDECTESVLQSMRIAEFNANILYEFGVINNNNIVCTTIQGTLSPEQPIAAIDLGNDGDIQLTYNAKVHAHKNDQAAMQIRFKHFRALLDITPLPLENIEWIKVGIFTLTDSGFSRVYGDVNVTPSQSGSSKNTLNRLEKGYWIEEFCLRETDCGVVSINILMFLKQEKGISFVLALLILSIVSLSNYVCFSFHQRYISHANQLKRGLNFDRISLVYQPIYCVKTMSYSYCEVLCRWRDDNHDILRPDLFIRQVELNGQSKELTKIVLIKAISELEEYHLLGNINFAVNIFPEDISSGHVYKLVDKYLKTELRHTLTLEITESEVDDIESMQKEIFNLRQLDLKISIDDFGTGYSNFQHLEKLHIDYLKIDKSFIKGIESKAIRSNLVRHIVNMAKELDLKIIAEGVEEEQQLRIIKELGVEMSQGYFHSRPVPIEQFKNFLNVENGP
jgi:sensor c-di-GMP phosphodiesterase-like protein